MSQETGRKLNLPTRLIVCLVVMVSGVRQCSHGLSEMSSGRDLDRIATAIDAQVDSGNVAMFAAQPLLMTMFSDADKLGLVAARQQDSAQSRTAHELFVQASAHFRNAAKLTGDASAKDDQESRRPIWALKLTSYNGFSEVEAMNERITALFRDESATDAKAVMDSILSSAHRRDSVQRVVLNAQVQASAAAAASKK